MIVEDCSITRLVRQTHAQVRQVYAMVNRVSESLSTLRAGSEENAESGWRRDII